ncbi:MAG: hypothetical protein U0361_19140 [Nitrospiraceae bacterium]
MRPTALVRPSAPGVEDEAGRVMLLENLRFHPEEEVNEDSFSKALGIPG